MNTLILLMHKKKTDNMLRTYKNNSLKTQMKNITGEELYNIHPDLNHSFTSPTINSGLMTVHHNNPEKLIDNPGYFLRYISWILIEHKGNIIHPTTTQVSTVQLYGGSKSHMFTDITMFTYIRPVKCNVKIINVSKSPAKGFGLAIIKIPNTNIVIPLWPSYYMPQNP